MINKITFCLILQYYIKKCSIVGQIIDGVFMIIVGRTEKHKTIELTIIVLFFHTIVNYEFFDGCFSLIYEFFNAMLCWKNN